MSWIGLKILNYPMSVSAVNCTDDPVMAPNSEKGLYDWDLILRNKSYTISIRYYCPLQGWGFPSNGEAEIFSVCQADKNWNLTELEECISKYILGHYKIKRSSKCSFRAAMSQSTTGQTGRRMVLV